MLFFASVRSLTQTRRIAIGKLVRLSIPKAQALELTAVLPAGGGIGPTRELARFYEMLLGRGTINGKHILSPQTNGGNDIAEDWVRLHGHLGAEPESGPARRSDNAEDGKSKAQRRTTSERYGPHASTRTFGHAGASGMQAFADPDYGLATAFIGRLPIHGAIYEDLGLVKPT